ncbi:MAG: X2-like carbohydrate binding domain-containing protein [Desulfosporosinus sp.]|nr:X2-like carbohydrate binding domain-containing protein [Desulfosporosinus sp.]
MLKKRTLIKAFSVLLVILMSTSFFQVPAKVTMQLLKKCKALKTVSILLFLMLITLATPKVATASIPLTNIGTINGTPQVGAVLTAGALTPAGANASYKWKICSTSTGYYTTITGATGSTYTPVAGDATKFIEVVATGTNGYSGQVTSATTNAVTIPITAIAAINGTPQVGAVLTAGALNPTGATVSYQWQEAVTANGSYTTIAGATGSTYAPVAGDVSKFIKVVATGIGSYSGTVTSTASNAVAAIPITAIGAINGTPQVGVVLTAGALTPAAATATYQWQICSTSNGTYANIAGATGSTYTPVAGQETMYIKVVATGTGGYSGTVTSATIPATSIPIDIVNFDSTNVAGDSGNTLLWSRGNASTASGVLRVAPSTGNQKGVVVRRNQIKLTGGFSTYFVMNMNSGSNPPADGLCFVIQSNPAPVVGNWGAGLGFDTVPNSMAVEFDIWQNTGSDISTNKTYYDPSNNYVAIVKNGDNTHNPANHDVVDTSPGTLYGGGDINVWIDYDGTNLTATYGTSTTKSSSSNRSITENVGGYLNNQNVYVGFSGSTGLYMANMDVKKWYFSDTYVPGGLDPNTPYTQGANSVGITFTPKYQTNTNPTSANFSVYDVGNNVMVNQNVVIYLDGSTTPITTLNTGADGMQANYSIGALSLGSHTITGVATNGGASDTATFNVVSPQISPTTATFDKNSANTSPGHYVDEAVTMSSLYATTLSNIMNGSTTLTSGSDYTVSGSVVTITKGYLAAQSVGTTNLTFTFSDSSTQNLAVTVSDSTPPVISPTTATFDKNSANTSAGHYTDVVTTMTLYSATLSSVKNGSTTLIAGSNYTVSGSNVTIPKAYLATQSVGTTNLTFTFSDGSTKTLAVTVSDSTPTINPTTATFDKNTFNMMPGHYADIPVTMTLNGSTLSSITNGSTALTLSTNYTVSGNNVTLSKTYLSTLPISGTPTNLTFTFSSGNTQVLGITVSDSTPTINPTTATFDKNTFNTTTGHYADIPVTMTLNGSTLSSITNGSTALTLGTNYTVSGNNVTLSKTYLSTLPTSGPPTNLTFTFSSGNTQVLGVTVSDSTPTINPTTATFDKNTFNTTTGHYADIPVTMTLNGSSLSSITNGSTALNASSDYIVSGNNVTLSKTYLSTLPTSGTPTNLTFTFSSGNTQVLGITVSDSTPTINPTTATFDKNTFNTTTGHYADIPVTMTLNGSTLSSITNGSTALTLGTNYTVSGSNVTISKTYLSTLPTSGTPTNLTFTFSSGNTQVLGITVSDSTPTIDPTTATFDKNTSNTTPGHYADIPVTMTLNGSSLSSITNGSTVLNASSDYTVSGSNVTISKTYLSTLPTSGTPTNLTFTFSSGNTQVLGITVSDTTILISNPSITTQTGANQISTLLNVPIQAIIGFDLSRSASILNVNLSNTNNGSTMTVAINNVYLNNQEIKFNVDSDNPGKILPSSLNTLFPTYFPSGTYTINATITINGGTTPEGQSYIISLTQQTSAQDLMGNVGYIDSAPSLNINLGSSPELH